MSGRDVQFVSTFYVATGRMGETRGTKMAKMKFAIATDVSSALWFVSAAFSGKDA